ncbi:MAG: HAMP domain-containing sensor histidine kinase [Phycisphaerae bacterium]|nr:HAMP domain-containing sensor histidine kinase [Phycisphaerae bacterium]
MKWRRRTTGSVAPGQQLWPVLLLLLIAVLLPTTCLLWFMNRAMTNERLAVRDRLVAVYKGRLTDFRDRLATDWSRRLADLDAAGRDGNPAELFAQIVSAGMCESAIIRDEAGRLLYPEPELPAAKAIELPTGWDEATRREQDSSQLIPAAAAYEKIARETGDTNVAASALLAQARCLSKAGQVAAAIEILSTRLAAPEYHNALDVTGRLVVPAAQLRALQLINDPTDPRSTPLIDDLARRVLDYQDTSFPRGQRLFIMREIAIISPDRIPPHLLAAETLAEAYLDTMPSPATAPAGVAMFPLLVREAWSLDRPGKQQVTLRPSPVRNVWQVTLGRGRLTALFDEEALTRSAAKLIRKGAPLPDASIELRSPTQPVNDKEPFLSVPVGAGMPEWQLALYLDESEVIARASHGQRAVYLWIGISTIVLIAAVCILLARFLARQTRLTRLKTDLIATVSHELRTPLAGTRALVETLLEGRYRDEDQVREYLQLIARENNRLSRLIDNFLTFSRMERNKRAFEQAPVSISDIVQAAVEAVSDRFNTPQSRLELQVAENLPTVIGDREALVTVLVNLLDNAYKYTGDNKHVILRANVSDHQVCLEVEDNGIGIPRRAIRKIFDRFYQVDQNLARKTTGCGLGLSIVQFIVRSHGGTVDARSRPGKGTCFTVRLPGSCGPGQQDHAGQLPASRP